MKKFITLCICSLSIFWGCEDNFFNSSCFDDKPETGGLTIRVSIEQFDTVPVKIYQGYYENNNLLFEDTLYEGTKHWDMPVNSRYTVAAEYKKEGKFYFVIDGGEIKTRYNEDTYTDPCWELSELDLNLKLK